MDSKDQSGLPLLLNLTFLAAIGAYQLYAQRKAKGENAVDTAAAEKAYEVQRKEEFEDWEVRELWKIRHGVSKGHVKEIIDESEEGDQIEESTDKD